MKQTRREFVRTLFVASNAAIASRFLPVNLLAQDAPRSNGLNFLVFGDWGREGQTDQMEVAEQMGIAADGIGARFVVAVGDNFYERGVVSVGDAHWEWSFEKVYVSPSLQIPWHAILGNHDYHGNCDAQIEYGKGNPRWRMPARYYQQSHPIGKDVTADFFYIDTTPMVREYYYPFFEQRTREHLITQDVPKQIAWLAAGLAASQAQWKFVIGHHPIYSGGEHGDTPELIRDVLPLLHDHGVQAYFNGHDHDLQHLTVGRINLFCAGAGSSVRPTKITKHTQFANSSPGFTAVSLGVDKMDVRMIDRQGTVLYKTSVAMAQERHPAYF